MRVKLLASALRVGLALSLLPKKKIKISPSKYNQLKYINKEDGNYFHRPTNRIKLKFMEIKGDWEIYQSGFRKTN